MRVKSNKALRRSARLARRAFISPAAALPLRAVVVLRGQLGLPRARCGLAGGGRAGRAAGVIRRRADAGDRAIHSATRDSETDTPRLCHVGAGGPESPARAL